jgi:hypothetical protein
MENVLTVSTVLTGEIYEWNLKKLSR